MRVPMALLLIASWAGTAAAVDLVPVGSIRAAGAVQFDDPVSVSFAADGSLWVADNGLGRVLHCSRTGAYLGEASPRPAQWRPTGVVVLSDGHVAVAAGDVTLHESDGSGMVTLGISGGCFGIAPDPDGGFWVTQSSTGTVRHWPSLRAVSNGGPHGLAIAPNRSGFTTSAINSRLQRLSGMGELGGLSPVWIPSAFAGPMDIEAFRGDLLVADTWHHRLVVLDYDLRILDSFGTYGTGPGQFSRPTGIAVAADGLVAVAELDNRRVSLFAEAATPARAASWGRIKALFR